MELSENALRAEIQKLGVAPIDGTAPLSSCVEQLLSAFEGMRSQVAASRSKWDEMMGALSEVSEQAQTVKKQVEAQSMKKQVEAQSMKKQVEEAQSMKKQVEEAQSMKKQVEAQSMKKQVEAQSLKKQVEEAVKDSDQQDSVKEAEVSEGCAHVKEMQEMIVEALEQ